MFRFRRSLAVVLSTVFGLLVGAMSVAAEGTPLDITSYTTGLESIISAITTYAPTLIGTVGAVIAGFFAVKLGLRFLRQHVK